MDNAHDTPAETSTSGLGPLTPGYGLTAERFCRVMDSLAEGCQLLDADLKYVYVNRAAQQHTLRTSGELLGQHVADVWPGFEGSALDQRIRRCLTAGVPDRVEHRLDSEVRGTLWFDLRFEPVPDGVLIVSVDITERKRAEELRRETEDRLSAVFHHSPVGIVLSRLSDGLILDANNAFAALYDRTREELIGRTSLETGIWDSPEEREEVVGALVAPGARQRIETSATGATGRRRTLHLTVERLRVGGEDLALSLVEDITERRETETALRDRDRLLRQVGRAAVIGGWEFSPVTGRGTWTEETARIHDLDPEAPTSVESALSYYRGEHRDRIAEAVRAAVEEARPYDLELELVTATGAVKWVRTIGQPVVEHGRVVTVWGSLQDITAQHQVEEQLRMSQKVEAIGTLAGGIAHDFNNLLVVILNYAEFALESLQEPDPLYRDILEIKNAGERAASLTSQLLAFSRRQVLQPVPMSLNQVVGGLENMLRRIVGEDVECEFALEPGAGTVVADPGRVEQVVMNLVVNARDAMPQGGRLTVATRNIDVPEATTLGPVTVLPGPYVEVSVSDTGTGMDADTKARIFDPFFTTKAKGKGTGLGLAMVYGIVKQSGGYVWADSEPGRGTTMRVQLPRELVAQPASKGRTVSADRHGTETVLVAEDEGALLSLVRRTLEAHGYRVLTAANGEEAVSVAAAFEGGIDLLLTDVIMPRMSGRLAAEALTQTRPGLRVLYMSGYAGDIIASHGILETGTHFLAKPFTPDGLLRRVREVLDPPPPTDG